MANLRVRDMTTETLARLKAQAAMHGRSLQAEVRAILEAEAALSDRSEWQAWMDSFRAQVGRRPGADSVELLRESRDER